VGAVSRDRRDPGLGGLRGLGRVLHAGRRGAQEVRRFRQCLSPAAEHLPRGTSSSVKSVAEANSEGFRIAGAAGTATFRASNKASPKATHLALAGVDAAVASVQAGQADAIALSRESLTGLLPKIPGARVLDGGFLNSTTAVAVPKGHLEALAYVSTFVEEAKASGMVRHALDDMGLTSSQVAPAGMKP
jgi:polar amino acid transport system substrate-binding protein